LLGVGKRANQAFLALYVKLLYSSQANHVFKAFGLWLKVLSNKNMLISGPTQAGKPGKLWSLALKRPVLKGGHEARKIPPWQEQTQDERFTRLIAKPPFQYKESLSDSGK